MEFLQMFIELFKHPDQVINQIATTLGIWTYIILFLIIFCETGLVVTPILPGDSMLFAAGAIAALGSIDVYWLFVVLAVAAILGDTVNYWIGHYIGPKVFSYEDSRFFKKAHLLKTHAFYERHGGKTIIIARFMPIVRTFAPFVGGIGAMTYSKFILYNVVGGILWVGSFLFAGYYFGNIEAVKRNFTIVIFTIVFISILPALIAFIKAKYFSKEAGDAKGA